MIRTVRTALLASLTITVIAGLGTAQTPEKMVPPKPAEESPVEGALPRLKNDPTYPSSRMHDTLTGGGGGAKGGRGALVLRGRVIARDKPAAALLEVDGKLYTIAKGTSVLGANNTIIRVVEVNASEVRLEVGPQKELIVLR